MQVRHIGETEIAQIRGLPARRRASPNRMGCGRVPAPQRAGEETGDLLADGADEEIRVDLPELQPLRIEKISRERSAGKQAEFSRLLERHHHPGDRGTVGENMQHLVSGRRGRVLACVLFGAAVWLCPLREDFRETLGAR